jgi:hypothetical protein
MWNTRSAYFILMGKPVGKMRPERLKNIWENNIKMDLWK